MRSDINTRTDSQRGFSLVEMLFGLVILTLVLGILGGIVGTVNKAYVEQRPRVESLNNASAAMDAMTRLIRMAGANTEAQAIDPGFKVNGSYNSIRIRADWNPVDGDLLDPLEDITFSTSGGILNKQEPGDDRPVPFLESIQSLTFTYYDSGNNLISDATVNNDKIAVVRIELETFSADASPMRFTSTVQMRNQ